MKLRSQKYNAKKSPCRQGHVHASIKEARHCNDLTLLERAGEIDCLEVQRKFVFSINGRELKHDNGHKVGINIDFVYREKSGQLVAADTKGFVVRDWPLRRAIFKALYPQFDFREV